MSQDRHDIALDWFIRLQAAPDDPALRHAFRGWYGFDAANAAAYDRVAAFWRSQAFSRAAADLAVVPEPKTVFRWAPLCALAAAVLALWLGVSVGLPRWQADYRTIAGQHQDVVLADGSRVVLNSASAIAVDMTDSARRQVRVLYGEAYFEVARDEDRPFVVTGGGLETRVLGTRFSVRADAGQQAVMVLSGRVRVRGGDTDAQLGAGQGVRLRDHALVAAETDGALSWLDGSFVFHDRPLADVVAELNRHTSGLIVVMNDDLARMRVSGHYRLDDPAAVARSLAQVVAGRVTSLSDAVMILR